MASGVHIGTATADLMVNAAVDQLDASAGTMKIFSGALPAECITADPSGTLVTITLPTPAFAGSGAGTNVREAAKSGTWSGTATGSGDAACFRIYTNGGTCIAQGTAGNSGDSPDLTFDNKTIASGAAITISAFTFALPYNPEG
jgi:hypothetical protein